MATAAGEPPASWRIAGWVVDPATGRITRDGETIPLEPKVMEVLVHLSRHPGQVVSREELEATVWRGRVVGYGGIMRIDEDAHIMTIAVDPSRRRQGIGRRMMLALVETALEHGAEHLTLEVRATNAAAQRLYEEFGFGVVGRRPRYYRDEDAIIMWVVDANGPDYRRRLDAIRERA